MKKKNLLKTFNKRYQIIEHDGGYILYDKEGKSKRANVLYIGKFYFSEDGTMFSFNGKSYVSADSLINGIMEYNKTLPFDAEIYNPIYRKNVMIEMAISDYLTNLGFRENDDFSYSLQDAYDTRICTIKFKVCIDSTEGEIRRYTSDFRWVSATFTDLDSAIGAVNSTLAGHFISTVPIIIHTFSMLTNTRASCMLDNKFDFKTMSVHSEDATQQTIELIEKELKMLKGDS